MAPLSAVLFLFSFILAAFAAPVPAPDGIAFSELTVPSQGGKFSSFVTRPEESLSDGPSVAARTVKLIPGVPPVNKSIFRRVFPGLLPGFKGFFPFLPDNCHGNCFLEKPKTPPPKNGKGGPPAPSVPPPSTIQAPPSPQSSPSPPPQATQDNVPTKAKGSNKADGTGKENDSVGDN